MRPRRISAGYGETIGRYHLHSQIAKGGMARIHIARAVGSEGFSRLVAAKRLHPALAGDRDFVQMFLDEARVASKVRHRNVVPVLDVVNLDGEVILVQELVIGVSLHTLCGRAQKNGTWLPVPLSVSIATQALAGLHAAHEATDEAGTSLNIVHRDVSPQNVMIAADGTARVLDFGVAKTAAAAHITRAGTFKGKLVYSAPEQLRGTVTRQTDIYALGIVLWELLVGKRLHSGRSDDEIRRAILQTTPPPITQAAAKRRAAGKLDDASWAQLEALEPILLRACAYDPAKRYETAGEMERELAAAVTPASLTEVASWLRQLAGDLLDETDRLIADNEASWRSAQGSDGGQTAALGLETNTDFSISTEPQFAGPTKPWAGHFVEPKKRRSLMALAFMGGLALAGGGALFAMKMAPESKATGNVPAAVQPAPHVESPPLPVEKHTVKTAPPPAETPASAVATETQHAPAVATKPSPAPAPAANPETTSRTVKETPKPKPVIKRPQAKKPAAIAKPTATPKPATPAPKPATTTTTKPAPTKDPNDCSTPFYYEGSKKIFKKKCL